MEEKNKKARKEPKEKNRIGIDVLGPLSVIIATISLLVTIHNLLTK